MTYTYETTNRKKPEQFVLVQSIHDTPFTNHPETGEPIRRIITGAPAVKCVQARSMARFDDYKNSQAYKDAVKARKVGRVGRKRVK